jgi:hypothetical protein
LKGLPPTPRRLGTLAALLLLLSVPAAAETLWQGEGDGCRLTVAWAEGALEVTHGGERARLRAASPGLRATATSTTDGRTRLTVSTAAAPPGLPLRAFLEVPASCDLRLESQGGRLTSSGPLLGPLVAETVTGEIVLCVEEPADLDVTLATSGEISVDFSVSIDYVRHQEPAKRGTLSLRSSGLVAPVAVQLTSRRGAIRVLECPEPIRPPSAP